MSLFVDQEISDIANALSSAEEEEDDDSEDAENFVLDKDLFPNPVVIPNSKNVANKDTGNKENEKHSSSKDKASKDKASNEKVSGANVDKPVEKTASSKASSGGKAPRPAAKAPRPAAKSSSSRKKPVRPADADEEEVAKPAKKSASSSSSSATKPSEAQEIIAMINKERNTHPQQTVSDNFVPAEFDSPVQQDEPTSPAPTANLTAPLAPRKRAMVHVHGADNGVVRKLSYSSPPSAETVEVATGDAANETNTQSVLHRCLVLSGRVESLEHILGFALSQSVAGLMDNVKSVRASAIANSATSASSATSATSASVKSTSAKPVSAGPPAAKKARTSSKSAASPK